MEKAKRRRGVVTNYEPFFTDVFTEAAQKLDKTNKEIVQKRIKKILENPFLSKGIGAFKFTEKFSGHRILYSVEGNTVYFLKLGKRDSVYRDAH